MVQEDDILIHGGQTNAKAGAAVSERGSAVIAFDVMSCRCTGGAVNFGPLPRLILFFVVDIYASKSGTMGGLAYGSYGALTALAIIGLCTHSILLAHQRRIGS